MSSTNAENVNISIKSNKFLIDTNSNTIDYIELSSNNVTINNTLTVLSDTYFGSNVTIWNNLNVDGSNINIFMEETNTKLNNLDLSMAYIFKYIGIITTNIIYGTDSNDIIYGTDSNDIIYGGAGNDIIHGGAGNDIIYGSAGNNIIYGGAGNDIIYGSKGNDIIYGGDGNDIIYSVGGNDIIYGGEGNNIIYDSSYNLDNSLNRINALTNLEISREKTLLSLIQTLQQENATIKTALNTLLASAGENTI